MGAQVYIIDSAAGYPAGVSHTSPDTKEENWQGWPLILGLHHTGKPGKGTMVYQEVGCGQDCGRNSGVMAHIHLHFT